MLKLQYLLCDSSSPLPVRTIDSVGIVTYGALNLPALDLLVAMPCLDAEIAHESWHCTADLQTGHAGALHYRYGDELLFGYISLDEMQFQTDAKRSGLQQATGAAYQQIFALLDQLQFPQLWRVWNFIPRINAVEHGLERYRQFNIDRQAAFEASGRAIAGNVPAASAVGTVNGNLNIYFIAGRTTPIAIENPRQTAAYCYPAEYGPRSPIFSRANLIDYAGQDLLFISGTASIVGHRTLHASDVAAQTRELLANIDSIIGAANDITQRRKFARADLTYKVYVRDAADSGAIRAEIEHWLGAIPRAIYLQADICRTDLLVEVEASAGVTTEFARA